MFADTRIKTVRDEARNAWALGTAVLEKAGGDIAKIGEADRATFDKHMDEAEAKLRDVAMMERGNQVEIDMNRPITPAAVVGQLEQMSAQLEWMGRKLDPEQLAELQKASPFPGFMRNTVEGGLYAKAFWSYMRSQNDRDLSGKLSADQRKALSAGEGPAGGYLVQDTFVQTLLVKERDVSAMRTISNVLPPIPSGSYISPTEDSVFSDPTWTTEILTGAADTVKPFGQLRLTPYPLAKRVLVSNTFLRTPTFDAEAYVRDRLAYKFGTTEEYAFVRGIGVAQPRGVLDSTGRKDWTTAVSLTVAPDDIINWVYSLPAAYANRPRTRILCNRSFVRRVRGMKSGTGEYIWLSGFQGGEPPTILGMRYAESDQMDDALTAEAWDSGGIPAILGDFDYYWIVDALGMTVQRLVELYAESNQVGYIGRKECGGLRVLDEAFIALVVKA